MDIGRVTDCERMLREQAVDVRDVNRLWMYGRCCGCTECEQAVDVQEKKRLWIYGRGRGCGCMLGERTLDVRERKKLWMYGRRRGCRCTGEEEAVDVREGNRLYVIKQHVTSMFIHFIFTTMDPYNALMLVFHSK